MKKNKTKSASIKNTFPNNNILFIIIIAFSFLLYGNTMQNDYSFDDKYNTPLNPTVAKGFDGFYDIFTNPNPLPIKRKSNDLINNFLILFNRSLVLWQHPGSHRHNHPIYP